MVNLVTRVTSRPSEKLPAERASNGKRLESEILTIMANASIQKQVDTTVKVLVTLLAEPRVKAAQLAQILEQSPSNVARLIARFRESGLTIDYDFSSETYKVDFTESLQKSLLGKYAKKLRRIVSDTQASKTPVKFVSSLDRYSLPQWAEMHGTTPQNVYNMIIGYKGAHLPSGWVAYQMMDRGKWLIQKMDRDRTGTKYAVPSNLKEAFRMVTGTGAEASDRVTQIRRMQCAVRGCKDGILSRGLCSAHYYMSRRSPGRFLELKFDREEDMYRKAARDSMRSIKKSARG